MIWREKALDDIFVSYQEPKIGKILDAKQCMDLAWQVAWQGVAYVGANPLVGAVAVDCEHRFLAAQCHKVIGKHHAEVNLIEKIKQNNMESSLKGATIYVTLEPCSHFGKTPPCAHLLASLPIKKVVYACKDFNPQVSGKGISYLKDNGIDVEQFREKAPFEEFVKHHLWYLNHKKPFIGLKAAVSFNGILARQGDKRKWISCERSLRYAHWLRLRYDSILVGKNTVIHDNPSLTIRHIKTDKVPLRIVIDPQGQALLSRNIEEHNLIKHTPNRTVWCCYKKTWNKIPKETLEYMEQKGVKCFVNNMLDKEGMIHEIINYLGQVGVASLLIEGGSGVWGSFLNTKKINRLHLFQSPHLMCGEDTIHWTNRVKDYDMSIIKMELTALDKDILFEGDLTYNGH